MEITEAEKKDIDKISELWEKLIDYHKDIGSFELKDNAKDIMKKFILKNIRSKDSIVVKAIVDGKIIGYCMAWLEKFEPVFKKRYYGYVSDGFVIHDHRGKGIMKEMILHIAGFFRQKGIDELWLRVYSDNELGVKSWEKIGFSEINKFMWMEI